MNKASTAGIILAAGMSKRFGQLKQMANLKSQVMISQVVENALSSKLDHVVLVLGHEASKILTALHRFHNLQRLKVVVNQQYNEGMAKSLSIGLRCVMNQFDAIMILLGDMPLIGAEIIDLLLDSFNKADCDICVPIYKGHRGHPVIFNHIFYPDLLALKGDIGAREIIRCHPDRVHRVKTDDASVLIDIDKPEDIHLIE